MNAPSNKKMALFGNTFMAVVCATCVAIDLLILKQFGAADAFLTLLFGISVDYVRQNR